MTSTEIRNREHHSDEVELSRLDSLGGLAEESDAAALLAGRAPATPETSLNSPDPFLFGYARREVMVVLVSALGYFVDIVRARGWIHQRPGRRR